MQSLTLSCSGVSLQIIFLSAGLLGTLKQCAYHNSLWQLLAILHRIASDRFGWFFFSMFSLSHRLMPELLGITVLRNKDRRKCQRAEKYLADTHAISLTLSVFLVSFPLVWYNPDFTSHSIFCKSTLFFKYHTNLQDPNEVMLYFSHLLVVIVSPDCMSDYCNSTLCKIWLSNSLLFLSDIGT